MRVQVFYPFFPIPRTEAAHHLVIEQMEAIAQLGHQVELVYWLGPQDSGATEPGNRRRWKALYIGDGIAEKESVFEKGMRVVKALWQGFATTEEFHYPSGLFSKIKAIQDVDLQIFHYSFVWKMLKDLPKDKVRRAVYFQNLESDLFRLRAEGEKNPVFRKVHEISALRLKAHELDLFRLNTELWFITPQDQKEYFRRLRQDGRDEAQLENESLRSGKVRMVPPVFDPKTKEDRNQTFLKLISGTSVGSEKKVRLGFIGGLNFEPNRKGMEWILTKLLPELKKAGFDGEISHVGRTDPAFEKMAIPFGSMIRFEGFVQNLDQWWASLSFSMIPDLTGAGVRIKLLESVASGIPVLVTEMGIERCAPAVQNSELVFASDDPQKWAEHILQFQPFEYRKKFLPSQFNSGLDGREIYRFL